MHGKRRHLTWRASDAEFTSHVKYVHVRFTSNQRLSVPPSVNRVKTTYGDESFDVRNVHVKSTSSSPFQRDFFESARVSCTQRRFQKNPAAANKPEQSNTKG